MRRLALISCLLLAGCSYIPWHPFGSPLTAEKKAEQRVELAKSKAGDALVEEVHKTKDAVDLAVAGNARALTVAQEHARVAVTLANQVHGAPTVIDERKWQDLVARQAALDEKVREIAATENARRLNQIDRLSSDLDRKSSDLDSARAEALQYAKEKEAIADRFLKVCWAVGAVVALLVIARILAFVAQFYPGLAPASEIVNGALSKVLHRNHRR